MARAWQDSTLSCYGSGLLVYHIFCDDRRIPETQRAPAAPILIHSFIAALAGGYTGDAIANYVCAVRAWHLLHGLAWQMSDREVQTLLDAAAKTTPRTLRRKKQKPCTPDFILAIRTQLDLSLPVHAAVYACLTTTFYAAARLGEFTVKNLTAFDPNLHVKRSDVRVETDRNGLKSTIFHLPWTKVSANLGEDVSWSKQLGETDPEAALEHHLHINDPPVNTHLFSYQFKKSHRPLTKPEFLKHITQAARAAGLDPLQGHGIRIGSTLEYLLRGVPFDVMKVKGRWESDAFSIYLTHHSQILAPYMQDHPEIHDHLVRLTMPHLRR